MEWCDIGHHHILLLIRPLWRIFLVKKTLQLYINAKLHTPKKKEEFMFASALTFSSHDKSFIAMSVLVYSLQLFCLENQLVYNLYHFNHMMHILT